MMKWFDIAASLSAFLGALVLLKYQSPVVLWVTEEGDGIIGWTTSPGQQQRETNKAQWRKYMRKYQIGVG